MIIQKQYMPQNYGKEIKNTVQTDREEKKKVVNAFPLKEQSLYATSKPRWWHNP